MLKTNGGLIGVRRTPGVYSASGLWTPDEYTIYRRTFEWPGAPDQFYSSNYILLPLTGTQGSTAFTDASATPKTITPSTSNPVFIDRGQSKWGNGSALFSAGSQLSFPLIVIGSGQNFTIEAWVRPSQVNDANIFGQTDIYNSIVSMRISNGQLNYGNLFSGSILANIWSHLAVSRISNLVRLFVNGIQVASVSDSQGIPISRLARSAYNGNFSGYMNDARITVGVGRYAGNFDVPTGPLSVVGTP